MSALIDPTTDRTLRHAKMLALLVDLTGGCKAWPGNTDVLQVVIDQGVMKAAQVPLMAHALQQTRESRGRDGLSEPALAAMLFEFTRNRIVRARMIRHVHKYHGIHKLTIKRDLVALRQECAEMLKGAGVLPWGES